MADYNYYLRAAEKSNAASPQISHHLRKEAAALVVINSWSISKTAGSFVEVLLALGLLQ